MGWCCALRIGVSDLHYGSGAVCMNGGGPIGLTQTGITAEDMGAAVLAAENCPLGEDGQTVKGCRPGSADDSIRQHLIVEGYIDAVVVPVEGYRLHIDIGVQKLGTADLCVGTGVQQLLAAGG